MQVSFRFDANDGFISDVPGKKAITIKNSLSNREENLSPTEFYILGMGSCTSDDVLSILKKMRADFSGYRCEVSAERNTEHPKTLRAVDIHYILEGDVDPEKARKAIHLSLTRYCNISILASRGGADITYSLSINGELVDSHKKPELTEEAT